MRVVIRLCILTVLFAATSAIIAAQDIKTGDWSAPVDGLRGRLLVNEDKSFHGTRMVAVYLELQNVSDIGNPMELYFDSVHSVTSRVIDGKGKELAQPPTAADVVYVPGFWLSIPWDGNLRFRVSVSGYGVYENSGTNVQMMSGNWLIKPEDKQKYFIKGTFVSRPASNDKRRAWTGDLKLPEVLIPH
jgi:hypothetical protein